jgi:hypothetical protein
MSLPGTPSRQLLALTALVLGAVSGCGYIVGQGFGPEVRTVAVPMFLNETYRRDLEWQLTEAVQKQIQNRTLFKLVRGDEADTRLVGRIVQVRKDVLGETMWDDPRQLQFSLEVRVTWEDTRTGRLLAEQSLPLAPDMLPVAGRDEFAPELGQSLATAKYNALNRVAEKIVDMMEAPW